MPTPQVQQQQLSEAAVRRLVEDWYRALDRHDPVEDVLAHLVGDGLVMHFPEGTTRGREGFRSWYDAVTHRFFDEAHTVLTVDVGEIRAGAAEVRVLVNWQTRTWNPPAATSSWLGFDARQSWSVVLEDGTPRIRTYTVDSLSAMPGSAGL
ncbi:nuclear transport factor 2 family protein [Kitasatospora sp. NPDC057223]|uniref:nuclear transport factor 2 family protein n=1 Tax=Kitasatospora sp. NPDC057223 TaxID=3346055 RepID=UPI00363E19DF